MALSADEGLFLAAIAVAIVIFIAWHSGKRGGQNAFCAGPRNLQLYDVPYFYGDVEAPKALSWDGDRRCAAYCAQSPCTVWCR